MIQPARGLALFQTLRLRRLQTTLRCGVLPLGSGGEPRRTNRRWATRGERGFPEVSTLHLDSPRSSAATPGYHDIFREREGDRDKESAKIDIEPTFVVGTSHVCFTRSLEDLEKQFQRDTRRFGTVLETKDGIDIAGKKKRLTVLGKPGAGKTTFLKHLIFQALDGKLPGKYIPVFISLKDWSDKGADLLEYITEEFDRCNLPEARPWIEHDAQRRTQRLFGKSIPGCARVFLPHRRPFFRPVALLRASKIVRR